MKNNGFFSAALFKENVKRFWPIAFVGFVVYFLSGPVNVISFGAKSGVHIALHGFNFGYIFSALALSVIPAICVFGYLQRVSSVSMMHSMPFSRKSLYITSYLSGLFIAVLPALLTAVCLMVLRKPVYAEAPTIPDSLIGMTPVAVGADLFSFSYILKWLLGQFILIAFGYTVSVFAGIIAGNSVIHTLTACALNAIVPALYGLYLLYTQLFLWGVPGESADGVVLLRMHPVFAYVYGGLGPMGLREYTGSVLPVYIVVTLAVLALGYILYRIRPLERATDSYVFRPVSYLITVLLVLLFGSAIGMIVNVITGGYAGFAIGSLASFVAAEMIVRKTTRIFGKESLISLALCAAVMCVTVGSFAFDLLGIEDAIPKAGSLDAVYFESYVDNQQYLAAHSEKGIEDLRAFHASILELKDDLKKSESAVSEYSVGGETYSEDERTVQFTLRYQPKNGRMITREYTVPARLLGESEELQAAYLDADQVLTGSDMLKFDPKKTNVNLWFSAESEETAPDGSPVLKDYTIADYQLTEAQKKDLIEALAADVEAMRHDIGLIYKSEYGNDGRISYGYLQLDCPISEAEYDAETESGSVWSGNYYLTANKVGDSDSVKAYQRECDFDLSSCGENLEAVILRLAEEVPGAEDSIGAAPKYPELPAAETESL